MDLSAIANAVKSFSQQGTSFLYVAALLAGIWLCLSAVWKIASKGMDRGNDASLSMGAIFGRLLTGSCLVTMGQKMRAVIETSGGASEMRSVLSYSHGASGIESNPALQLVWAACSTFLVFLGTLGFFRGLLKFDRACQGAQDSGDAVWAGLWHCVGGALTVAIFS